MNTPRPFELSTDLGFLYKSDQHERVFQEALRAIERREGLICVTGEPGTGKTLLCERLSAELDGTYEPVYVSDPSQTPTAIAALKGEQGYEPGAKAHVLIVDEAQHLDPSLLDEIKFIWNRSMADGNPLHVVLVGQPELAEAIARNAPLAQRVGANLSLGRLELDEILPYLSSRLARADLASRVHFTQGAVRSIFQETCGVPRLVNRVAQLALERAADKEKSRIGAWDVYRAASGLAPLQSRHSWPAVRRHLVVWGSLGIVAAAVLAVVLQGRPLFLDGKIIATKERYGVKVGPFVTREGAERAAQALEKDDIKVAIREQKLVDGWMVYEAYLRGDFGRTEADRMVLTLQKRYGLESSLISLPY